MIAPGGAAAAPVAASAASTPAVGVKSASAGQLVRFVRPTADTLVEKGTGSIRVIIETRAGARLQRVDVDGVDIRRRLRRGSGGYYRGLLPTSDLHYGYNTAFAQAAQNGRRGSDHARFIAAKRDKGLLRVTSFRTRTAAAPLQIGMQESTSVRAALSVAQGVSARVYVNDQRAKRAFTRADWSSIQDDLGEKAEKQCAVPDPAFTEAQCDDIRGELRDEVSLVSKVTTYFGPDGLQEAYREANVSALASIPAITGQLSAGGLPPLPDNDTSNILLGISNGLKFGAAIPGAGAVTTTLSTAFLMGSYFTRDNGSPDFIGPAVSTEAGKLGVDLDRQYNQAGDDVDNLGRLIVSDYGKLTAVAGKINATPRPGQVDWRLGDVGQSREAFVRAAKQTIYERLVPAAYPEMYDLGGIGNARDWYCQAPQFPFPGASFFSDKHLFQDQSDGAQLVAGFPSLHWAPLIAVAARHAVGSTGSARIPGVPGAVTDELFNPIAKGGLRLNKYQFYSPRNGFEFFPNQPHPAGGAFNSIQQFPYADDSGAPIKCEDMPNPPGNAAD